eukprot:9707776-Karenia_brevis.AAC.1
MGSTEERLSFLESSYKNTIDELNTWRGTVDAHIATSGIRLTAIESTVKELIKQFEQMGHKDKDGPKGLKKAF